MPRTERSLAVLVTGGAGYVGAVLVPKLLRAGHHVRVLDLFLFGDDVLPAHPRLECVRGDIRDQTLVRSAVAGVDVLIHLACISNDPSFELDPVLGKSINYDSFEPLVQTARDAGVGRFVYASTSSVYGISDAPSVTEDHPLVPLTDYSRYKAMTEPILLRHASADFTPVVIRPATVCGYSPRMRLDLTVNILTSQAVNDRRITIFGGSQKRPNIHIDDVTDLYELLVTIPRERIHGKVFNAGHRNLRVEQIADLVREVVEREMPELGAVTIERSPTNDLRSYQISSERIERELGWVPKRSVEDAVADLCRAFRAGLIPEPTSAVRYHNVKALRARGLA